MGVRISQFLPNTADVAIQLPVPAPVRTIVKARALLLRVAALPRYRLVAVADCRDCLHRQASFQFDSRGANQLFDAPVEMLHALSVATPALRPARFCLPGPLFRGILRVQASTLGFPAHNPAFPSLVASSRCEMI